MGEGPISISPSTHYCDGCGAFAIRPLTHGGKTYCPVCYAKFLIPTVVVDGVVLDAQAAKDIFIQDDIVTPIGESDPIERDDSVNVPFALQKKLLHSSFYDTTLWLLKLLEDDDFMADLELMADARLEVGHGKFGSTMYAWDFPKRFRAIMEELADVYVFKSSEGEDAKI